jgi:hypothetical protein
MNDHTNEVSEFLQFNIAGLQFTDVRFKGDGSVRGYVVIDLGLGTATIKRGPITLKAEDLEKQ